MAILVTGGCGFIGSHFVNKCFDENTYNIINVDALYYCSNINNVRKDVRENPRYTFYNMKLQEPENILNVLNAHNITRVVHFAAQSHVQNSFDSSLQFTDDNVLGTHNLLEACRKNGNIELFIHCSTDEVYGETPKDEDDKKTETSLLLPTNPYAATKAAAELLATSYYKSFNLPVIITRGNNVYGPNQFPEKVIPKFIKQLKEGKKITIQGDGSAIRGFLYIDDVVSAFITILNKGRIGDIYNIGCEVGNEITIFELAKLLIDKLCHTNKSNEEYIDFIEDRPFNDHRYYISSKKLKELGWCQCVKFEDGIDLMLKI